MLKLKIIIATLGLAGMITLLLGDTYLTAGLAVICTAMATPLSMHLTLKWMLPEENGLRKFLLTVWTFSFMLAAIYVIRELGIYGTPLSAPIDFTQKIRVAGDHVSSMNALSVILAVIAPSCSSTKHDDEG